MPVKSTHSSFSVDFMIWLRKRWGWIVAVLVIGALGAGLKLWPQKNAVPEYKTTKIERGALADDGGTQGIEIIADPGVAL